MSETVVRRNSNIELLRIVCMMAIVAHHFVNNSGLVQEGGGIYNNVTSFKSLVMLLFGAWGKTGINCFVMITGYFMCTSHLTIRKYIKLIGEIYFYRVTIYIIFAIFGYETISMSSIFSVIVPFSQIKVNFLGCFMIFYLLIPFLNILIKNMSEKLHVILIILLVFIYVLLPTFIENSVNMNYISWFCILYFVSSYIRIYDKKIFNNVKFWTVTSIVTFTLAIFSIVYSTLVPVKMGNPPQPYYYVADCNKILAFALGISIFMLFKNINIKYNKYINAIAATTFGVLLIHANSDAMRQWLWGDFLHVNSLYESKCILIYGVFFTMAIFILCSFIDMLRIKLIEKPFMKYIDKLNFCHKN